MTSLWYSTYYKCYLLNRLKELGYTYSTSCPDLPSAFRLAGPAMLANSGLVIASKYVTELASTAQSYQVRHRASKYVTELASTSQS